MPEWADRAREGIAAAGQAPPSEHTIWMWLGFLALVLASLGLDLFAHRREHVVTVPEALRWTLFWVTLALGFNAFIWWRDGHQRALEFLTGYLIEQALSVDNIFVFIVIFQYFAVPAQFQHRVLLWGVIGAIVMRLGLVFAGVTLLQAFDWVKYVFGGILVWTAFKVLRGGDGEVHPERNPVVRLARRLLPMTQDYRGSRFTVLEEGRRVATPLLLVVLTVEATDLVFALDSVPAVLAVTTDTLIVYTSNIFAILGLRNMFFLLAGIIPKFRYLKVGLGVVLAFVGLKLALSEFLHIPIGLSLAVVGGVLGSSVLLSLLRKY